MIPTDNTLSTNQCLSPPPPRPFGIMTIAVMLLVPVLGDAGNGHDPEFTPPANEHLVIAAAIVSAAPCFFMGGDGARKKARTGAASRDVRSLTSGPGPVQQCPVRLAAAVPAQQHGCVSPRPRVTERSVEMSLPPAAASLPPRIHCRIDMLEGWCGDGGCVPPSTFPPLPTSAPCRL